MKKLSSLIITGFLLTSTLLTTAQDCRLFFPEKVGAVREMTYFDNRDRATAVARHEIIDKQVSGNNISVKVKGRHYTVEGEEIYSGEFSLHCEDGVFKLDMQSLLDPATLAAYKDMGIEITADNLIYPSGMKAGDNLPEGSMQMVVKSEKITIMTISIRHFNRKVVAREDVTTDAGTFNCLKISYETEAKVGFITSVSSAVEHISEGVGVVRSETFNRRGRSEGYSLLTSLK